MVRVARLVLIAGLLSISARPGARADVANPERARFIDKIRTVNRWGPDAVVVKNMTAQLDQAIGLGEDAEFDIGWGIPKDDRAYRFWWVDGKFSWEFLTPDEAAEKGWKRMDITFTHRRKGTAAAAAAPASGGPPSIQGSTWVGETLDTHQRLSLHFEPGGVLDFFSHAMDGRRNGAWTQDGAAVHLDMNKGYVKYDGIIAGDRMSGNALNKLGAQWQWNAVRQPDGGAPAAVPAPSDLVGTTWTGVAHETWSGAARDRALTFQLQANGVLGYRRSRNSTWTRNGGAIHLELNNGFAVYDGTVVGGRMEGTARNRKNMQWTWSAVLQAPGAAGAAPADSVSVPAAAPAPVAKPRPPTPSEAKALDGELAP
jgi:hypothetical protein